MIHQRVGVCAIVAGVPHILPSAQHLQHLRSQVRQVRPILDRYVGGAIHSPERGAESSYHFSDSVLMPTNYETRRGIKFSLKTFLIVLIAVGVGAGVMGRLSLRHPEIFLGVLSLLSTAVPFLLAIVTILWIGFRQKPAWSTPICGECMGQLRERKPDRLTNCPECGADLTDPKAVLYVRVQGRRWGLVVWGGLLLVTPVLGIGALFVAQHFIGPSPSNLRGVSTKELIQQRLPKRIDEPWVWRELENRLTAGKLSQKEVDEAVQQLIAHMKTTRPQGWDRPLNWQDDFLKSANQAKKISDPVLFALCDAFYGPKPVVEPLPRIREGQQGFEIEVKYGSTWSGHSGLGVELLWEVTQVLLDGKPIDVRQNHKHGERWSGHYDGSLAAGDYEVTVEIQCAYVDQGKLVGLNAHDLPAKRWPKTRRQWKQTASAPLKVYTKDVQIVPLSKDPRRDPNTTGGIEVSRFVVQADRDDSKKLILKTNFTSGLTIPLSCDVEAVFHDQRVDLGRMWVVKTENSTRSSGSQLQKRIDTLAPSVKYADIILTPNPSHIEHRPEVSEIWGEKIILRAIPVERLDLEASS